MKTTVENSIAINHCVPRALQDGEVVIIVDYKDYPILNGKPCIKWGQSLVYLFQSKDGYRCTSSQDVIVRFLLPGERVVLEGE